jgi:hypothetical protein
VGVARVDVDIDPNEGGDSLIYQLYDDRFFLIVWVDKARLDETRGAISSLGHGYASFGTISCGERVWIVRDESGCWIAIGDADSKDAGYRITEADLGLLLDACPPDHGM